MAKSLPLALLLSCADFSQASRTTSSPVPAVSLAGSQMIQIKAKADEMFTAAAIACSADDQTALAAATDVHEKLHFACSKRAFGIRGIDHDKFTACTQSELGISAGCSECYYNVAEYTSKICQYECLHGFRSSICVTCTQPVRDQLSGCTGLPEVSLVGSQMIQTQAKADEMFAAVACSADDQTALADAADVHEKQDACSKRAFGIRGIDHDMFTACMQSELGISAGCTECYYNVAEYTYKICRSECLRGFANCEPCTQSVREKLSGCTGLPEVSLVGSQMIQTQAKADEMLTAAAVACSADDQTALADAADVREKQDACSKRAISTRGIIYHDKFTACTQSELGISAGCSECFYNVAEYSYKICRFECLLGFGQSNCVTCTQPVWEKLSGCTGLPEAALVQATIEH